MEANDQMQVYQNETRIKQEENEKMEIDEQRPQTPSLKESGHKLKRIDSFFDFSSLQNEVSATTVIRFKNVFLLRNHKIVAEDLWLQNGKFIEPQTLFFQRKKEADIEIDGRGQLIAPGFIDIQINGKNAT